MNNTRIAKIVMVILLFSLAAFLCGGKEKGRIEKSKQPVYLCNFTTEPIKVNGLLDETVWQEAKILEFYIYKDEGEINEKPLSKTEGRLLWDDEYLYVGFKAYDKDIWGYLTERDSATAGEDVLETFFKTGSEGEEWYYNFEINALGGVYDAFNHIRRDAGGGWHHRWNRWNCEGLKMGVKIKGTLNNWEDIDEYWQMEVAIPFASLPTLRGRIPNPNDIWTFQLGRYDFSIYLPEGVELSSCAQIKGGGFHNYKYWLKLKFVK